MDFPMKSNAPDLMKFKRLQRLLGESTRGVVGLLEMLWMSVAKNCPRGDVGRFANDEIAIMCDWPGDPDALVNALHSAGWLDQSDVHRLVVHDWHVHAPKWVKGVVARSNLGFATLSKPLRVDDLGSLTKGGQPSNTKSSQVKITSGVPDVCPTSNLGFESGPTAPHNDIVLTFPVRAAEGKPKTWELRRDKVQELQDAFPDIDVVAECKKALAYVKANRPKTANGMPRYLFGWIAKENNFRPGRQSGQLKQQGGVTPEHIEAAIARAKAKEAAREAAAEAEFTR